jgi:periplasmic divalent cation tolerance protein
MPVTGSAARPGSASLLVISNLPDQASAETIARRVVEAGLAACVNILAPCLSVYRWQGKLETAQELPLLIKTTAAQYDALEAAIRELHPYELPEIIAVGIERGLEGYLDWVAQQVRAPD